MQVCPDIFGLDEDSGKAVLFENETNDACELIKEAVDSCPIGCINE
jgi:ferredoxin